MISQSIPDSARSLIVHTWEDRGRVPGRGLPNCLSKQSALNATHSHLLVLRGEQVPGFKANGGERLIDYYTTRRASFTRDSSRRSILQFVNKFLSRQSINWQLLPNSTSWSHPALGGLHGVYILGSHSFRERS